MFTLLCHQYPAVLYILTQLLHLAFQSTSGFKNKWWAGSGLQNAARLQVWLGLATKGFYQTADSAVKVSKAKN